MQNTVQTPFTYRSPFTFTGQAHGEVWNQQIGEPFPYRYPVINQPHRQPVAVPATTQSPSITYNNIGDARYPYRAPARQPVIYQHTRQVAYDHRSPSTYQVIANTQNNYDHRSPFTYARQGRTPEPRWDGVAQQQWPGTPITS